MTISVAVTVRSAGSTTLDKAPFPTSEHNFDKPHITVSAVAESQFRLAQTFKQAVLYHNWGRLPVSIKRVSDVSSLALKLTVWYDTVFLTIVSILLFS